MIDEEKVKKINRFGDFYDFVVGDILRVLKPDGSSNLELLVGSNKNINFYQTCKMISEDKSLSIPNGNGNCAKKIVEICYLSQDSMDMRGHRLVLAINDKNDKRRDLYHKYFDLLSEKGLI